MEDLIKRSDAAEMVYKALKIPPLKGVLTNTMSLAIALVRDIPSADRPQKVIAQITFDEEKLREIVKEAVEHFKKEYEIADKSQGEWIYGEHDVAMCDGYRCNRCGFFVPWDYEHKSIDFINDYNYCPNCGISMEYKNEVY